MAPRLIEGSRCPHCKAELPEPKPRACPECMGSLQVRYLKAGCLTSKPLALLVALGLWQAFGGARVAAQRPAAGEAAQSAAPLDERPAAPAPEATAPGDDV